MDGHRLTEEEDLPLVRTLHAVKDLHQGGLTGAVLPDDGVNLPATHGEVNIVVGHHAREPLGDTPQLYHGCGAVSAGGHCNAPARDCPSCTITAGALGPGWPRSGDYLIWVSLGSRAPAVTAGFAKRCSAERLGQVVGLVGTTIVPATILP